MKENWKQWTRGDGYIYLKSDEDYEKSKVKALAKQDSGYGHSMYNDENIVLARNSQAIYCGKCYQYTYHTYSVGEDIHADYGEYEDMTVRDGVAVTGDGKEIPKELCANCGDFHPVTSWAGPTRFELSYLDLPEKVKMLEWFYNEHSEDDIFYRYEVRWENEGFYHDPRKFHCLMRYQRSEKGTWYTDHYTSKLIFLGYDFADAQYAVHSCIRTLLDLGTITEPEFEYQLKKFRAKRDELYDEGGRIIGMTMPPGEEE
jgi:hypothetical protein